MILLKEITEDVKLVEEATSDGQKKTFITGPFMQAEQVNRNRRFYGWDLMKEATNDYINDYVNTGRAVGELSHPNSPSINPDRICHRIVALEFREPDVYGKALITNTPCGDIVKGLMESGVRIGVSSRCLGSMREDTKKFPGKTVNIVEKMKIVTAADVVMDPSAPDAFVDSINEQREWVMLDDGRIIEKSIKPILENSVDKAVLTARKRAAFMKFIKEIGR